MRDQESSDFSKSNFQALFNWEPDLQRFRRQVRDAEAQGVRDELCLVEMECSIDLIDADLLAARGSAASASAAKLRALRGHLAALIGRMNRLPC